MSSLSQVEPDAEHQRCGHCRRACSAAQEQLLRKREFRYAICNDTALRAKVLIPTIVYYGDVVSDILQLRLFLRSHQLTYFNLNAGAILLAAALDLAHASRGAKARRLSRNGVGAQAQESGLAAWRLCGIDAGLLPFVGQGVTAARVLQLRQPLGREASREELGESAARLLRLRSWATRMESTALIEAVVEGALSLLVQGFALAYESRYTRLDRLSLALSLAYSTLSLSWALAQLDGKGRVLERITITVPGPEDRPGDVRTEVLPSVCGSCSFAQTLRLVPLRWVEVLGRAGPIVVGTVACKLAWDSETHRVVFAATLLLISVELLVALLAGPPGAWRRLPHNFLALAEPLGYPASVAVLTVPKTLFYAVRSVLNVALSLGALSLYGYSPRELWEGLSAEGRPAGVMAAMAGAAALLTLMAAPLAFLACPAEIPEATRRAFSHFIGVKGQTFPEVEDAEDRRLCERLKLLPREQVQDGKGAGDEEAMAVCMSDVEEWCLDNFGSLEELTSDYRARITGVVLHTEVSQNASSTHWGDPVEALRPIEALTGLKYLKIIGVKLPTVCWLHLVSEVLPKLRNFEGLKAADGGDHGQKGILDDNLLFALSRAFVENGARYTVSLRSSGFSRSATGEAASEVVPEPCGSEILDLEQVTGLTIKGSSLHASLPALRAITSLHRLRIAGIPGDAEDWKEFATEVLPTYRLLKEMRLHRCCLHTDRMRLTIPTLRRLTDLRSLDLSANPELGVESWSMLAASVFPSFTHLEKLHLAECKLNAARLQAAAPGLEHLVLLQEFVMEGNREIDSDGWDILAHRVFPAYMCLEVLSIQSCALDVARLRAVAPGLGRLSALQKLCMRSNPDIDAEGWGVVAEVLSNLPQLQRLEVGGCGLACERALPNLQREGLVVDMAFW